MRVIDREQAKLVAGFRSTTRANTRLLALTRAGFLNRFFAGTILGGRKGIYTFAPKAAAIVDGPPTACPRKRNETLAGVLFLEHQMLVNSIYTTVKCRPIPLPGISLQLWRAFRQRLSSTVPIMPDGYFELEAPTGVRAMFLEVDLGTERLSIWRRKVRAYLHLAISGQFLKLFQQSQFRVLVVAMSDRRLATIRQTVARLTDKIFWFSTFELINREGFWSPIWLRPQGDQRQSLL